MNIHETAIVHPKAQLGEDVGIGPYSIIGENTTISSGTRIGPHVHIEGWTTIGNDCRIFTGASIGNESKDLKYNQGDRSFVIIGNRNSIREYTSISRATGKDDATEIGDDNLLMTGVHVAHDCKIGNNTILASYATLCGHVTVEDRAILGAQAAFHQFIRVGTLAFAGACAKVVKDIPPYIISDGYPARVRGLNIRQLDDLSHCLRWHTRERMIMALMTDPVTNAPTGIERTFLGGDGRKRDRMMLGTRGVIRLTPDEDVGHRILR